MKKLVFLFLLSVCFFGLLNAQKAEIFSKEGKAIKGFDPVGFFIEQKAIKGADSLTYSWKNANWFFATHANLEAFKAHPEKYAPQFGGYCAYGTADGHKAPTETDTWTIVNDKLYFNYNQKVKGYWMQNQLPLIEKANSNWPIIKDKD